MELEPDKEDFVICEGDPICIYPIVGLFQILVDTGDDNKRLITLLGESHGLLDVEPPNNAVSVRDYVLYVLESNRHHARIGLEIGKNDTEIKDYSSPNIDNILKLRSAGFAENIIGMDIRRLILEDKQDLLYIHKLFVDEYGHPVSKDIINTLILSKPGGMYSMENLVTEAIEKGFVSDVKLSENSQLILKSFADEIEAMITQFNMRSSGLINTYNLLLEDYNNSEFFEKWTEDLVKPLEDLWQKINDYFILRDILAQNKSINEIVIVIGFYHAENIANILSKNHDNRLLRDSTNCISCQENKAVISHERIWTKNPLGQPSHCVDCMWGYPLLNYCISLFNLHAIDDNICKKLFKDEGGAHAHMAEEETTGAGKTDSSLRRRKSRSSRSSSPYNKR